MAATVTMQQLQDGLKVVEDDLGSFIKSQKNNLRKEKLQLARGTSSDELQKNTDAIRNSRKHVSSPVQSRKEYRSDIDKEYGKMLQKKKNQESLYRVKYDVENVSTEGDPGPSHERKFFGKKIIEFNDSDEEMFKYVLELKEKNRRQQRSGSASEKTRHSKVKNDHGFTNDSSKRNDEDDGRSSSVPPPKVPYIFGGSSHANVRNMKNREHREALEEQINEKQLSKVSHSSHIGLPAPDNMPYVFGGSSHAMMRRQRNIEHKQALEEQIKEKEDIKTRERLKRIGKITQTLNQSNQYPSNAGIEVLNDDITKLVRTDEFSQYSNRNVSANNKTGNVQSRKEYKTDIDKEYGKMLQKKKNEESSYRVKYDVENLSTEGEPGRIHGRKKFGKKIIEFDDSDDELLKYVLQEKEKSRRQQRIGSAAEKTRHDEDGGRSPFLPPPKVPYIFGGSSHTSVRNMKNREHKEALEEQIHEKQLSKVSNSSHVGLPGPPEMPYVFGGSSHAMMRRQRNIEHKQALEEQIKEKEDIKTREKLKRIGKITQTLNQSNQYPSNAGVEVNEVFNNDITKLVKTDEFSQYSNRDGSANNKTRNVIQPSVHQGNVNNSGYPIQNSYGVNPMFNHMMMYPVGWPGYGSMMPNGYAPNNMVPFPQGTTTTQQVDTSSKKHVPNDDNSYVPSAIHKINNLKPSTKVHSPYITSGASPNEPDLSAKRAQQIAYQNELKTQMEIKKAAAEKDRQEREKYEMKLDKEVATYDPWGKSGCGAPVKNKDGKIVADLKKFLQGKEDTVSTSNNIEEQLPDDLSPLLKALEMSEKTRDLTEKDNIQHDTSPSHRRGVFTKELQGGITSPRDKEEQSSYKEFLQQQVVEKKRKEEELKEKERLAEEKENKRLAQQQQRMREEYEEEKEKQRRKAEEIRKENEARGLIAEQKRLEEDRKKKEIEDERDAERKREAELKLAQDTGSLNGIVLPQKSNSPPVPGVVKKERKKSLKERDMIEKENAETMQYLNTIRDNLNNIKDKETDRGDRQVEMNEQENLIHQLSALRKQLMRQEEKVQSDLHRNKKDYSNLVSATEWNRTHNVNKRSAFDRATSVKSGRKRDTGKFSKMEQLTYDDNYNKEQIDLDTQQQEYMRQQEMRLLALRQGVENSTLPSEFHMNRQASKQSLLESESKFFSLDNPKVMGNTTSQSKSGYEHKDTQLESDVNSLKTLNKPDATDAPSISASMSTLQVEDIAQRNEDRLASLNNADIAEKNKKRQNKLEQDEGSGTNMETNEQVDKIINDYMQDE